MRILLIINVLITTFIPVSVLQLQPSCAIIIYVDGREFQAGWGAV